MATRKSVVALYEEKMTPPPRNAPKHRSALYFYDYTKKIWRAAACDEDGKLIAVES